MKAAAPDNPTLELSIDQPFDLASSLESGQAHRWSRDGRKESGTAHEWHWGVVSGNHVKIRPSEGDSGSRPYRLELRSAPTADPEYLEPVFVSYFRLDDDIEGVYQQITKDPRVAMMVHRYRGLRLLRTDPWECLIAFICSANSNIPRIHSNLEAISESFGEPVALDGYIRHTFPTPERLATPGEAALRALGLGFRAPYVARAALTVAAGELDLESLRHIPYHEAQGRLMELAGVGPKIADCVLLHSLDKLEAFPVDVWVRRALAEWYFPGRKAPPDRVMVEWAQDHFGTYAGYAELYLFHGRRLAKA